MADNTLQNGADSIATDELSTLNGGASSVVKVQRVKPGYGVDGDFRDISDAFPMPVKTMLGGLISTANSSTVALGIGGVFTGAAEDVTEYADVRIMVFSDQASAVDGLQIQQSSNGTNWDVSDPYSIPAATGKVFSIGVSAKFFRVVYTNSATAQAAFRLQVKFGKVHSRPSSVRPQDGRTNDNDMDEVLSHLMGYNGSGWDRMRSSISNGLLVDVSRILTTINVAGTRNNNGTANVAGSFHLTVGGSDGTNLRPMSVDTTGRLNVNAILAAETAKIIGTVNQGTAAALASGWPVKVTDGTNSVGITSAAVGGNETTTDRLKVNASLRVLDTAQVAGSQLVAARGDQTTGIWVNIKNAAVPVTGAFFQATQPVSFTWAGLTDAQLRATPVPISLATNTPDVTDRVGRLLGQVTNAGTFAVQAAATLAAETTKVIGTVNVSAAQSIAATQATAANLQMTATPITLAKGTQGATGFTTQDLKDAGRVAVSFTTEFSPIAVAEAMLSLSVSRDGATPTAPTSYVIPAGKRLRITSISSAVETTLGTSIQRAYLRLRFAATGGALTTSPLQMSIPIAAAGVVKSISTMFEDVPDGLEFLGDGTRAIGMSLQAPDWVTAAATLKVYVTAIGFEY